MRTIILILAIISLSSCGQKENKQEVSYLTFDTVKTNNSLIDKAKIDSLNLVENKEFMHSSIIIDSVKYYIVEGDILLDDYEYNQYRIKSLIKKDYSFESAKIVGEIRNNKIVKWPMNYVITFCINKNTFRTINEYNTVKENINIAIKDWEKTCNVKFYHDESKDDSNIFTPTSNLTFVVLGFDANSEFIASAFFPYDPAKERRILIDPSYFSTNFNKVGVLRHELGHVIGFRHEHIRSNAPSICPNEDLEGTIDITEYDPKSVMHYYCGGVGDINLQITEIDKKGSQLIYGSPIN